MLEADCDCACGHTGGSFQRPCSVPGGCGPHGDERPRCGIRCLRVDWYGLCDRCASLTARDLDALPGLYVELHTRLAPGSGSGQAPVSGSKDRPLGFREDVYDHLATIVDYLITWTRVVAEERRLSGPRTPPTRRTGRIIVSTDGTADIDRRPDRDQSAMQVEVCARWLAHHHDWAVRQSWCDDYGEQIRDIARIARRLIGDFKPFPQYLPEARCPTCGLADLWMPPGDDCLECHSCQPATILRGDARRDVVDAALARARGAA